MKIFPSGSTTALAKARGSHIGLISSVVASVNGSSIVMIWAFVVAETFSYDGEPPAVKILPATASYMTATPHMASESFPRVLAGCVLPLPEVPYQFIALLGP